MQRKHPLAKCEECPLRDRPYVPSNLVASPEITFVGEAPGYEEARAGTPFVGQSGKLLRGIIKQLGHDPDKASYINVVSCHPDRNAEPDDKAQKCCRDRLLDETHFGPIVTLGKVSKLALVGFDSKRGEWQDDILPTWHPAYVLRKPSEMSHLQGDIELAYSNRRGTFEAPSFTFIDNAGDLDVMVQRIASNENSLTVIDIETNQVNWYDRPGLPADPILLIGLRNCGYRYVIDAGLIYDDEDARTQLRSLLCSCALVGHNIKFDLIFMDRSFWNDEAQLWRRLSDDTMLLHYTLDENTRHGLKGLSSQYLGVPDYEGEIIGKYLSKKSDEYSKIPIEELSKYLAYDLECTAQLRDMFIQRAYTENCVYDPYTNFILRAQRALIRVEQRGIPVDLEYLRDTQDILERLIQSRAETLRQMSGHPELNPNSPIQIAQIIWDEMKLPPNTKTRKYKEKPRSTDDESLEHLRSINPMSGKKIRDGNPFIDALFRYRRVMKIKTSYVDNLVEFSDVNGYVHPDIKIAGTETGRLAMTDPGMQTIPRPSDPFGRLVRGAIAAKPGKVLLILDVSQAELRVLAWYSKDPFLLEVYREDRDLHSEVARAMFGDNYTKEQRVACKMFNFAWAYGGNEHSFAQDQGLDISVARAFVARYNKVMAGAVAWKKAQEHQALTEGYVSTPTGRKRRFPLIADANVVDIKHAAINFPVQSFASDITLMAAVQCVEAGLPVVHLVHDSIILEAPEDRAEEMALQVEETMKRVAKHYLGDFPWKVDLDRTKEGSLPTRWCEPPSLSELEAELITLDADNQ